MKHFLDSLYEYANEWVDVIASLFPHIILIFFLFFLFLCVWLKHVKCCISKYIRTNNIFTIIQCGYTWQVLLSNSWNMWFLSFGEKINGKLWGNDIIDSFICIFISTVQEMFHENCENSKFYNFLMGQKIKIWFTSKFHLFCQKCLPFLKSLKTGPYFSFRASAWCLKTTKKIKKFWIIILYS